MAEGGNNADITGFVDFKRTIEGIDPGLLLLDSLKTLQVNLGNRCNQSCGHCHVNAGPDGTRIMERGVMERIVDFLGEHRGLVVDVTGGCPELNPDYRFFLENVTPLCEKFMARTNLTVFFEPGLDWVPGWYRDHKVTIIASLPCYTTENVDRQRGGGVFEKSIKAIKMLNELGYGKREGLELNLVYNPGGGFLPGPQSELEADYKGHLNEEHGISFTKLFTITNAPIGRFRQFLESNGGLQQYLDLLAENFNPSAAANIMCRSLVSVDYRGILYNCDFNQALDLGIVDVNGEAASIESLHDIMTARPAIVTGAHCYCCTAGAGSSCTGALAK